MNINYKKISWADVDECCQVITQKIKSDKRVEDIEAIVGLSRGGLVPATILANWLNVRKVYVHGYHSYDETTKTRNKHGVMYQDVVYDLMKSVAGHNILIVDDLCDKGVTMKGLVKRMYKKFHEHAINIRTATLYCKEGSEFVPDYIASPCTDDTWLCFPWEPDM